ncbi:MAG: hypothetical protein ACF8R9_12940 [Phycisphaerales bacterium JB054]
MRHAPTTDLFSPLEARVLLSDDHANLPDYADATPIELSSRDGITYSTEIDDAVGVIEVASDTDLFRFTAPGDSDVSAMTVYQRDFGELAAMMELRDANGAVLGTGIAAGGVSFLIPSFTIEAGEDYYIVARSTSPNGSDGTTTTGRYAVFIAMDITPGTGGRDGGENGDGNGNDGGGNDGGDDAGETYAPDDYADRDDSPFPLFPNPLNADASITAGLQHPTDSDAFSLRIPGDGPVRLQLRSADRAGGTPADPGFAPTITVIDGSGATRGVSTGALPDTLATLELVARAGENLTVIVESGGGEIGDYALEIDASPALYRYYYPAGYSTPTIEEFVPMVNPNDFDVSYSIFAHYETGEKTDLLGSGTIKANSRGGITVTSARIPGSSLTRQFVPYAFEVVASGPIGANLGHYDFGATTGEAFTETLSTRWEFAELERSEEIRDFVVFFNPNPDATTLHFTLLDERGVMHRFERTLEGGRRGGINVDTDNEIPGEGLYALWIDSDDPIVAAQTTYDIARQRGDGNLGQPSAGSVAGAFAGVVNSTETESRITFLNSSGDSARLRITGSGLTAPVAFDVPARSRVSVTPAELGLRPGGESSLVYTASAPVTARVIQFRHGDGDALMSATQFGRSYLVGAAWVDPRARGTYIERLELLNPNAIATDIEITFLFTDGTSAAATVRLGAEGARTIAIDEHEILVRRGGPTAFSLRVESSLPIAASFSHYDLFLQGGWGTLAAPMGLTVPAGAMLR